MLEISPTTSCCARSSAPAVFPSSFLLETLTPVVRSPVDILFAKFWISIKGLQIILPKIRDAMNTTTVKARSIMIMTVIIVWYFA